MRCACSGFFGSPNWRHLLHRGRELGVLSLQGGDRRLLEPPLEERHLGEERDDRTEVAPVLDAPEQQKRPQQEREDEQDDERDPGPERHGAMVPGEDARAAEPGASKVSDLKSDTRVATARAGV